MHTRDTTSFVEAEDLSDTSDVDDGSVELDSVDEASLLIVNEFDGLSLESLNSMKLEFKVEVYVPDPPSTSSGKHGTCFKISSTLVSSQVPKYLVIFS